jgi:hypothetical protein
MFGGSDEVCDRRISVDNAANFGGVPAGPRISPRFAMIRLESLRCARNP